VRALRLTNPTTTGVIEQRRREAERRGRKAARVQAWIPLSRIARPLIQAVVVAEDGRFFDHRGVDWDAIRESARSNWERRALARGGSTITQQLAKNLFFTTARTPLRKLQEIVVARWLEEDLDKQRILELYLNVIEWGDGVYGCEAAAQRYFGKSASALDASEAAGLAAIIPSPRRMNPRADPGRYARAQKRVFAMLARAGYVRGATSGLGSVPIPPPEVVLEDEADEEPPPIPESPAPEPTPTPEEPAPTPEPTPTPTPSPTPSGGLQ
jgi:monofunctional biosynthetic peptidoglycan transglycosylase